MDPIEQLNDQLRQRAHAEQQKEKLADRRLTPQERQERDTETKMRQIAKEVAEATLQTLTIQSGQNASVTGSGRNMTISTQPGTPPSFTGTGICNDDGTITITIQG